MASVYHDDPTRTCSCAPSASARHQKRVSGPPLDRLDIHVETIAAPPNAEALGEEMAGGD